MSKKGNKGSQNVQSTRPVDEQTKKKQKNKKSKDDLNRKPQSSTERNYRGPEASESNRFKNANGTSSHESSIPIRGGFNRTEKPNTSKITPLMSLPLKEDHVVNQYAKADRQQRTNYYYSNPGCAPSTVEFHQNLQHDLNSFPIDKNVQIYIENEYNVMISSTNPRCKAWYIRVKSQKSDDVTSVSAMISLQSTEAEIREACLECVKKFNAIHGSRVKQERAPFSECSEEYLKGVYIVRLDEPPEAFPEAIYYCSRCDFHISSVSHAKSHLEQSSHFDDIERYEQRVNLISKIPEPSEAQISKINKVLEVKIEEYEKERKISPELPPTIIFYIKMKVFEELGYSNVELCQYGSTKYNVDLHDSDVNISFMIPNFETSNLYDLLVKVAGVINTEGRNAEIDDHGNSSSIIFKYDDVKVRLCWYSSTLIRPQLCLAELLTTYCSLRVEVVQFLRLIRLWATKSGLDSKNRQHLGLPRYGFDLMAIHYLQQEDMIPVLHEMIEEPDNLECSSDEGTSECSKMHEEARERRIRIMSRYLNDVDKIKEKFDLEKDWPMGKLWIGFFKYYILKHRDAVVQITQKTQMTKDSNRWNRKCLHLVDPFRGDNVLSIPKSSWPPYFFHCVLCTFMYYAIPRTYDGPIVQVELLQNKNSTSKKNKKDEKKSPTKAFLQKTDRSKLPINDNTEKVEKQNQKEQWAEWPTQSDNVYNTSLREIDDDEYNRAADQLAEEYARAEYTLSIMKDATFDGIPLLKLNSNDVEIDEHVNMIYSQRTMKRVRRKYKYENSKEMVAEIAKDLEKIIAPISSKSNTRNSKKNKEQINRQQMFGEFHLKDGSSEKDHPTNLPNDGVSDMVNTFTVMHITATPDLDQNQTLESNGNVEDASKPKKEKTCEFGEFTGPSNYEAKKVSDDNICYSEFFIRESFDRAEIEQKMNDMDEDQLFYEFEGKLFSNGYEMETKCISCDGNHCVDDCPPLKIPKIERITKQRTSVEIEELNAVIDNYYEANIIPESRLQTLQKEANRIQKFLKKKYERNIVLTIFGSMMTGIGVNKSDIDICLRFDENDEPPKDIDPKDVIVKVAQFLKSAERVRNVQPIISAKVPIVKFQVLLEDRSLVDVDISYYNILALHNTRLLKQYTLWTPDNRFAKLGLFVKHWAKFCDIGDASKGSISSYAHIILLISYLQQCDPPVLPRLQEDFRPENYVKRIIENWDTYFYEDIAPNWQKNTMSCAQLLIGFFDYYAHFDYKHFVIQCRREAQLPKLEKEWNRPLSIEDPFDLHHNLGSGVSMKMFAFICRTIIASRKVFMSSNIRDQIERDERFTDSYRRELLNECSQGHAPTDRQCHTCGRIGHFAEGCPRRGGRDRKQRNGSSSNAGSLRGGKTGFERNGDVQNGRNEPGSIRYHNRTVRK